MKIIEILNVIWSNIYYILSVIIIPFLIWLGSDNIFKLYKRLCNPRLTNEEKIKKSEEFRDRFDNYNITASSSDYIPEVIIRDVKRISTYPNHDNAKGISSWFRVGFLGIYHRGIIVGLSIEELVKSDEGYRCPKHPERGNVALYKIGRIPFESIENVNWSGDEYYNTPHVYCHFEHNKQPYEEVVFCQQNKTNEGRRFYTDIVSFEDVKK